MTIEEIIAAIEAATDSITDLFSLDKFNLDPTPEMDSLKSLVTDLFENITLNYPEP
jgi:hypothetical protein